jgi:hypothetical protein
MSKTTKTSKNPTIVLGAKKRASKRHGAKDKLYALLPRKGSVKLADLVAKAEQEGLKAAKVTKWIPTWAKKQYIELR